MMSASTAAPFAKRRRYASIAPADSHACRTAGQSETRPRMTAGRYRGTISLRNVASSTLRHSSIGRTPALIGGRARSRCALAAADEVVHASAWVESARTACDLIAFSWGVTNEHTDSRPDGDGLQ